MNLKEISEKYNVSESSLKTSFPRSQKAIYKKYGVTIVKIGRGKDATYREEYEKDNRSINMYEEEKDSLPLSKESLKMINWDFMIFLAIIITPMAVFRGSFEDFLKYIEIPVNKKNLKMLKETLISLKERDYIEFIVDKTDSNYFIAALYKKVEEELQISSKMVSDCKRLAEKYNKKSWIPLLKVWLGVQILSKKRSYTVKELERITGLSSYQIRENNKILKESQIYKTFKVYENVKCCIGTKVDLNNDAFFNI